MKVLFVCSEPFPYSGACTSLLNKLLFHEKLNEKIGEIHVLSVKRTAQDLEYEVVDGITIHRCFPLSRLSKGELRGMMKKTPVAAAWLLMLKMVQYFAKKLFGSWMLFDREAEKTYFKMLNKLKAERFDLIVPVCGQYETGSAAMRFCMRSQTPFVPYLLDPCATNVDNKGKRASKARSFEEKLYHNAAALIMTPVGYRETQQHYPQSIVDKSHSMELPNLTSDPVEMTETDDGRIRCVYAGMLYARSRNPRYAVRLFSHIHNPMVELHFYGITKDCLLKFMPEQEIGSNIFCHGVVSLEEAKKAIAQADILVNIGNIMENQIPSKLFEYISACRPIVNVSAIEACTALPYLEQYPCALSVLEQPQKLEQYARTVEDFVVKNAGRVLDKELIVARYRRCTAEFCAQQMAAIITQQSCH